MSGPGTPGGPAGLGAAGGRTGIGAAGGRAGRGRGAVVALGPPEELAGFALAGALLLPARSAVEAVRAWEEDLGDAVLVVLTAQAAGWLGARAASTDLPLTVVVSA